MFLKSINKTLVLEVDPGQPVQAVKDLVQQIEGFSVEEQRLIFEGRQLDDNELVLAECGVGEDSTLHLDLRLIGGGKKRKKKQYTGPKKQKHVRKKHKLAVLKLYKIDDATGKIQRQRIECISPTCGAGIFMAKHADRVYCGKCHSTMTEKK